MRIQQHGAFLKALVKDVVAGQLLPAAFQRPYVWNEDDVQRLATSVLKGYPLGGFLLWSPPSREMLAAVSKPRLGPIEAAAGNPSSLLLDGQNRLTTLAWMHWNPADGVPASISPQERDIFCGSKRLVVDLHAKAIGFVPAQEALSGLRLPVFVLLDSMAANQLIREQWQGAWRETPEEVLNEALRWFDQAQARFSDARVVVTDMEGASPAEAKEAFLHICKVGVPMSEQDFEAALSWKQAA